MYVYVYVLHIIPYTLSRQCIEVRIHNVYTYIYIYIYIYIHLYVLSRRYVSASVQMRTSVCMYTYPSTYAYAYTYLPCYKHTYTHTHVYAQSLTAYNSSQRVLPLLGKLLPIQSGAVYRLYMHPATVRDRSVWPELTHVHAEDEYLIFSIG